MISAEEVGMFANAYRTSDGKREVVNARFKR
jgi:hypothetical protein